MIDVLHDELRALALLIAANATPVVASKLLGERWSAPLDFGVRLSDGERLLGAHKTWRGLLSGMVATALTAAVLGVGALVGLGFATVSLVCDAASSCFKRRMHLRPGIESPGIDQLGEALIPLLLFAAALSLDAGETLAVTATFIVLDVATARLRHRQWLR